MRTRQDKDKSLDSAFQSENNMQDLPHISVITPSFNQGKYIERTIKSVLEQGYPNLEHIIIDGGSTDGTAEIVKRYEKHLVWICERDNGQSDAINKGIRMATGDIICYLNTDDKFEPGALKTVGNILAQDPSVMWLSGRCRIIDEHDREIRRVISEYKNFLLDHYSYRLLLITNLISQPSTFWRRQIVEELGLFDESEHLAMDYEYWLRIGKRYSPKTVNRCLSSFRIHQSSKSAGSFLKMPRHELLIARKYSKSNLLNIMHLLNYYGVCGLYSLLAVFSRIRSNFDYSGTK